MSSDGVPTRGIANRDIFPSKELLALHPDFEPLVENPIVATEFAQHEAAAMFWKRLYTWL